MATLLEAKAKFFDLQREVDKQEKVLNDLYNIRAELVRNIETQEKIEAVYPECSK